MRKLDINRESGDKIFLKQGINWWIMWRMVHILINRPHMVNSEAMR